MKDFNNLYGHEIRVDSFGGKSKKSHISQASFLLSSIFRSDLTISELFCAGIVSYYWARLLIQPSSSQSRFIFGGKSRKSYISCFFCCPFALISMFILIHSSRISLLSFNGILFSTRFNQIACSEHPSCPSRARAVTNASSGCPLLLLSVRRARLLSRGPVLVLFPEFSRS